MKRSWGKLIVGLTLSILLVASLAGCGSQQTADNGAKGGAASTANSYPNKPIQLLLVHKAGSSTDIIARTIQPYLSKELGVQVVVQNVPGGGGVEAMDQLKKAKPDGYTLLMSPFPSANLKQVLTPNVDFDVTQFSYVAGVSAGDNNTIAVAADSPYKTYADLVAASKTKNLKIAGSGVATNGQFVSALLQDKANLKFTYVPFEGGPDAINAVLGHQVDATVADIVGTIPLVNSGKLRLLAVTGSQRDPRFKDVPTVAESGSPDVAVNVAVGIIGPTGLPEEISKKLSDAISKAVTNPELVSAGQKAGFTAAFTSGTDLKALSTKLLDMVTAEKATLTKMK